jgi:selenoprotein W-related protein
MTATPPLHVTIAYCAECGYAPQTLALAEALMNTFEKQLSAITLVPADEGSFDVSVGDTLIHSMYRDGGFPDHHTIIAHVKSRLVGA